ncbi:MAG: FtsW/RodA/SpoVE family cell cycle protein [Clostridia bacterium]|nr:FtsW/RodA/SpoVE family cell cycle protein [Clostridia bacterium]
MKHWKKRAPDKRKGVNTVRRKALLIEPNEARTLLLLVLVELLFLFYTVLKGYVACYFWAAIAVMATSLVICYWIYCIRNGSVPGLFVVASVLVCENFVFYAATCSQYDNAVASMWRQIGKYAVILFAAMVVTIVFEKFSFVLSWDKILPVIVLVQTVLIVTTIVVAPIDHTVANIQPLEIVKLIYVFVVAALICKAEKKPNDKLWFGFDRQTIMLGYTVYIFLLFAIAGEMGTLLVMVITAGCMMVAYSNNRRKVLISICMAVLMCAVFMLLCILFHNLADETFIFTRMYTRIFGFLDASNGVPDGELLDIRRAIATGGWFGPKYAKYAVSYTYENTDLAFSKLVQHTGVLMGILTIILVFLAFVYGMRVARATEDSYYSGLAMGFTVMFTVQAFIHIGMNCSVLPVIGIPMPFLSTGFSSMGISMVLFGFLFVISTGSQGRSELDEQRYSLHRER